MLPIFPLPPPEEEEIPFAELVPDPPPVDPVPIRTIEGFRGATTEACYEVLTALEENTAAHLSDMRAALHAALSVRESYEDYSCHPTLTTIAHELAAHMCAFGALPIPPERFPRVRVGFPEEFLKVHGTQCLMCYDSQPNTIMIHTENVRSDGNFPPAFYEGLGEELGHFFRAESRKEFRLPQPLSEGTRGWVNSWLTEEFYGYMGRRILQEALRGSPLEPICFPSGKCKTYTFLQTLRHIRKELRNWFNRSLLFSSFRRERRARRKSFLTHARGYSFAQMIDISRITNWHAFFALPESDVRRRFFRKDQDYSGL